MTGQRVVVARRMQPVAGNPCHGWRSLTGGQYLLIHRFTPGLHCAFNPGQEQLPITSSPVASRPRAAKAGLQRPFLRFAPGVLTPPRRWPPSSSIRTVFSEGPCRTAMNDFLEPCGPRGAKSSISIRFRLSGGVQIGQVALARLDPFGERDHGGCQRIATPHHGAQVLIREMGVEVDGDATTRMPHDLRHGLDVGTLLDGHGREAVAQGVRTRRGPQAGGPKVVLESFLNSSAAKRRVAFAAHE